MGMKRILTVLTAGFLFLVTPHNSHAAGFYIQEQSVRGLGYAFAGSSTILDDASTVYFNPAGMTNLSGPQVNAGAHVIAASADLENTGSVIPFGGATGDDGGNPYDPAPIPNFYAVTPTWDDRVWVGIGVSAPFGLANDYGNTWFGRFDSTQTELTTINIQPSVAFKPEPWLSIGAGLDIQYADANLESITNVGTGEAVSTLEGDDWSLGYNVGVQIRPLDGTVIGAHYRSGIDHTLRGSISLDGAGAADFDEGGQADLNLPEIATIGVAHEVTDDLRVMAQGTWFGWNSFESIAAIRDSGIPVAPVIQNYQTTWAFAAGVEYDVNQDWTVRAGYQFDATPTTDQFRTSRTPDGDRNWATAGVTYKINDKIDLDFAAAYINISDETINVTRNAGLATVSANTAGSVGIAAIGLTFKF